MNKALAMMVGMAIVMVAPMAALAQSPDSGAQTEERPDEGVDYNYTDPYWYYTPEPSGFNYTDGNANGTYVDFLLDEDTGTITDYTNTIIDYNYFYPMVYMREGQNGGMGWDEIAPEIPEPTEYVVTWFDSIEFDGFVPNGHPMVFRESLVYMGDNMMATFTDYECSSIYLQFGDSNGTVTFTVPDGIEISEFPRYYEIYGIEPLDNITGAEYADMNADGTIGTGDAGYGILPDDPGYYPWFYEWDEAYLSAGNISCSIWVDRGSLEIDGQDIIVHTYTGASLSTSSWLDYGWTYEYAYEEPWFEDVPSEGDKGAIEGAMEDGLMAAVGYLFMGDGGQHYDDVNTMNDPSFQMKFMNVERNRFQVQVDSDVETGRIVTMNVNKEALEAENMHEISVLLDGDDVRACGSMEELVDMQGGTEAGYYMVSGTSQNTIFVYVPHFSTHIISVGLTESQIVNVLVPAAIAACFIAVAVGLVYLREKRSKNEGV